MLNDQMVIMIHDHYLEKNGYNDDINGIDANKPYYVTNNTIPKWSINKRQTT